MSQTSQQRGLIPASFIDNVLNQTDLVDLIDAHVPLKKRGQNYTACCPFHDEKTPSFNVVAHKQYYHCFGCSASGNAISFAMHYLNYTFIEAVKMLAQKAGLDLPLEAASTNLPDTTHLSDTLLAVNRFYQQQLKTCAPAIAYLKKRLVTGEMAKRFALGYAPDGWHTLLKQFPQAKQALIDSGCLIVKESNHQTYDRYRHRLTFPIHNRQGRIIGFGSRALDESQQPKYLNSPETSLFHKNRELYGLYHLLEISHDWESIIIVEGYLDVIALAQHEVFNAVATLGTATSSTHLQILSKYTQTLYFCFDGDKAGRQAAWRALETTLPLLNQNLDVRFVFLPDGHDPDSYIHQYQKAAFLQKLHDAIPLHQYLISTLLGEKKITSIAQKSQFIAALKPYWQLLPECAYQQLLLAELAKITHLDIDRLTLFLTDNTTDDTPPPKFKPIKRSPMRLAIALLLQHPTLYQTANLEACEFFLNHSKPQLLHTLMRYIAQNSQATTANLIELCRDSASFEQVKQLAVWEHGVPNEALAQEFTDLLKFLHKQQLETTINHLIHQSRTTGLSDAERVQLQTLLKQKLLH
ncbi:MAG TPA: DNA primase [Legionellales bacterium]|nr:DNA primase [Legionellales bacterium]|tara:strand:- start:2117 stop:3859 length:1743 start_codon:yes stop_codon:yes gene_type:complete